MSHAPDDEYDYEAQLIQHELPTIRDESDLAECIFTIFISQFDDDFKKTKDECLLIACRILNLAKSVGPGG